nr:MFS transporter [Lactobacillus delbrueckii]
MASIIGLPIGTLISTTFSWHASFWMISLLTLVTFILLLAFVPRDTPQSQSSKGNKQFAILGNWHIQLTLLAIILVCAAQYTYYTYIRTLITNYMHFPKSWLNVLLLLLGLAFIAGNKTGGFLGAFWPTMAGSSACLWSLASRLFCSSSWLPFCLCPGWPSCASSASAASTACTGLPPRFISWTWPRLNIPSQSTLPPASTRFLPMSASPWAPLRQRKRQA